MDGLYTNRAGRRALGNGPSPGMLSAMNAERISLRPFWTYVFLFKLGAGLHYALLSVLGARILPLWLVGALVGGGAFVQLVLDVPAGRILDRLGYARLLRWGTLAFLLAVLVLTPGLSPVTYVATLVLSTAGWLFFGPGANAYMLAAASRASAGRQLGFYHAVSSAGVVGSALALTFVVTWDTGILGGALAVVLAAAAVAAWVMPDERASVHAERKVKHHGYYVRRHLLTQLFVRLKELNPASTLLLLQNLTGAIFYASIWFTIPILLASDAGTGLWGISLSVFDLAVVLLGSWFGRLADRANRKRLVFCGLLLFGLTGTLLGFNLTAWFLVLGFLATAGDELSAVSLWAWLDQLDSSHEDDGLVNGAIVLFSDLGWAIGPAVAGLLYAGVGPKWTIAGAAVPIFLVWAVAAFSFSRLPRHAPAVPAPARLRHKR